ncbi:hypothetical protein B7494_g4011 [Chlorociboria aeruginascens]|nr:hypothetical protein B7494_g4011 [Chlorociboria aeruginascens]
MNQGDEVEILIRNNLPFESTIHFHGIEQIGTPWSDGVPGLAMRPIQPGGSFLARWTATTYGTFWYHAHTQGQLMDGLYGSMFVAPYQNIQDPFNLISNDTNTQSDLRQAAMNPSIVMVTDWNHFTSVELHNYSVTANIDPICMDSILVNGKGAVNCQNSTFLNSLVPPPIAAALAGESLSDKGCLPLDLALAQTNTPHDLAALPENYWNNCTATDAPLEVIQANPSSGWISLNFVSSASTDELTASIDGHRMWVYAADGLYIQPQLVDAITFPHGSRYSALIQLNQEPGDYTIRVASSGLNQKVSGFATLSYTNGGGKAQTPAASIDYGGVNTTASIVFYNAITASPYNPIAPSQNVDVTHILNIGRVADAWVWGLNGTSFTMNLEDATPLLFDPSSAPADLTIATNNGSWVDLIFNISTPGQPSHPIHKHSTKMFLIGAGSTPFIWSTVAEAMADNPSSFNLVNPPLVDNVYTPPNLANGSWAAIRYQVVNPGAFLLHCHINPHLEGGLAMALLDGIDKWPTIPQEYLNGNGGVGCS